MMADERSGMAVYLSGEHAVDAPRCARARGSRVRLAPRVRRTPCSMKAKRMSAMAAARSSAALLLHLARRCGSSICLLVLGRGSSFSSTSCVALDQLAGGEAHGNARALARDPHECHDAVQAAVDGAAVHRRPRRNPGATGGSWYARHVQARGRPARRCPRSSPRRWARPGTPSSFSQSRSRRWCRRCRCTSSIMLSATTIGHAQLHQLQRQIQVALDVRGVHDVDDAVRLLVQQEIAASRPPRWCRATASRCPAGRR